jgi:hypothetical protein
MERRDQEEEQGGENMRVDPCTGEGGSWLGRLYFLSAERIKEEKISALGFYSKSESQESKALFHWGKKQRRI